MAIMKALREIKSGCFFSGLSEDKSTYVDSFILKNVAKSITMNESSNQKGDYTL